MYPFIQLAFFLGVEEKSWVERSWTLLTGGGTGLAAGIVFFLLFGAVGWVSGAAYGAIGLLGLATGGALGGLGLGALANLIRNPDHYDISVGTISVTLTLGTALAIWLAQLIGRKLSP